MVTLVGLPRAIIPTLLTKSKRCVIASTHFESSCPISRRPDSNKVSVPVNTIALGSDRAAKIMAVRASVARIAALDPDWAGMNVIARRVEISAPAMPLTDWQLMEGARERALAARDALHSRR